MFKNLMVITSMSLMALSFSGERADLQEALDSIYRADSLIVDGQYDQARREERNARSILSPYSDDSEIQDARSELSESMSYLGDSDSEARDHLNNAESIIENRIENLNRRISRSELQETLDHIYRADSLIVDGRYSRAKNEENDAIDILEPYTHNDSELADAVSYLRRSIRVMNDSESRSRDELNNAESIIERRLRH